MEKVCVLLFCAFALSGLFGCQSTIYEDDGGILHEVFKPAKGTDPAITVLQKLFQDMPENASITTPSGPPRPEPDFLADVTPEPDGKFRKIYRIRHQPIKYIAPLLKKYMKPTTKMVEMPGHGDIILTDTKEALAQIGNALKIIDAPTPQVLIEVLGLEVSSSNNFEYGLELANDLSGISRAMLQNYASILNPKNYLDSQLPGAAPFQGTEMGFAIIPANEVARRGNLSLIIRALAENGCAEILTKPKLLVLMGKSANIETVSEVPYQTAQIVNALVNITTSYKKVGVKLVVTPSFIGKNHVTLDLNPEVSNLVGWTDPSVTTGITNPIIASRSTKTIVNVRSGDILIIGGLREKKKIVVERRIPILGDIPILGYLFRSTRRDWLDTEIVFFLKTTIIDFDNKPKPKEKADGQVIVPEVKTPAPKAAEPSKPKPKPIPKPAPKKAAPDKKPAGPPKPAPKPAPKAPPNKKPAEPAKSNP
ncbi:MAG: type II secretion system protein GspD [Planctomycetota bacterium]|jgi:type II secretory pathway component GspD/PulD (secretin)